MSRPKREVIPSALNSGCAMKFHQVSWVNDVLFFGAIYLKFHITRGENWRKWLFLEISPRTTHYDYWEPCADIHQLGRFRETSFRSAIHQNGIGSVIDKLLETVMVVLGLFSHFYGGQSPENSRLELARCDIFRVVALFFVRYTPKSPHILFDKLPKTIGFVADPHHLRSEKGSQNGRFCADCDGWVLFVRMVIFIGLYFLAGRRSLSIVFFDVVCFLRQVRLECRAEIFLRALCWARCVRKPSTVNARAGFLKTLSDPRQERLRRHRSWWGTINLTITMGK